MAGSRPLISAIVIGAGFAGLSASIELAKRGVKVIVFESAPDMKRQGDVIQIGANATRLMESWGNVLEDVKNTSTTPETLDIMNKGGKVLLKQNLHKEYDGYPNAYGKRALIQAKLYEYAMSLGVEVRLGSPAVDVFETGDFAGCSVAGQTFQADLLIAADGVHSKTRKHVTGFGDRPKKSGFAVYRSWFPLDDTGNIEEDWNLPGDIDEMLTCVKGWDPLLSKIVRRIPPEVVVDYKLLWRDPVSQWVSDGGRVCLIGDSAHPHLPTAGTGAAQAIEDAATIGVLVDKVKLGMVDIPTALRAYHKLRFVTI
ncbi:hypothetical protein KVR01_011630 [Diaporthe batatas]|uniref:uncharacterized protein n=1 Tax=Diaporthe batatas TaxID=748121 RepID=UPI001D045421|nr:uncharacterized protein KVR01_011630 [Diaporthe batatas]KAG8158508.1 hypothetical protein KVR01_011630 [Diaporthe batatas]